ISFHSLEDKLAKEFGQGAPPSIFVRIDDKVVIKSLYKKPITPLQEELRRNIRARSAKMRVFEKL
ncbi:16S rRNA (cytosine(1402)-N(4))-methyltransferase, partial [candidate division WWE3 bacterium RBG_13_37_7]